jgi:hypothetical protein
MAYMESKWLLWLLSSYVQVLAKPDSLVLWCASADCAFSVDEGVPLRAPNGMVWYGIAQNTQNRVASTVTNVV